jgi:predicted O-linked N-acetylglucosamine transferase (SPINDLY family)
MENLIAETQQEYQEKAVSLARDLPGLAILRATLRGRMQQSPLMNAPTFARNIEAIYRKMWRNWCEKAYTGAQKFGHERWTGEPRPPGRG